MTQSPRGPPLLSFSPGMVQAIWPGGGGPILLCPVWHLSLIDGLQMHSCEKAHYIVIKISFSVGDNVNSLSKMPTVSNWLPSEPIAWPNCQSLCKGQLFNNRREGRKAALSISLASQSVTQYESQPRLSKNNMRECLGEPCIPDQKESQPLDPSILLKSLSSKEKHHYCWSCNMSQ